MTAPRAIPDDIRTTQARASDPEGSAFVAANAGAGKTHVLVQRVIRLLLQNVAPEKILCITFTKAAAANMAQRVFDTLGAWITLDDAALDAAIAAAGVAHPGVKLRNRARQLFASALETPGGLKVQTIHALCTRLLQQFPFEANVPARFSVLDDRDQADMMERASLAVLLDAAEHPESETGRALAMAMSTAADVTFRDVVREACITNQHFLTWIEEAGSAAAAMAKLSRQLGVTPQQTLADVTHDMLEGPNLPSAQWPSLAALLDSGTKNDATQGARLRAAAASSGDSRLDHYLSLFLTGTNSPRKTLVTKALAKTQPGLAAQLDREGARLLPLIDLRRAVITRDRTQALLAIASAVVTHYRQEKQQRGLLDYNDLIDKTLAMLARTRSSWVHYKLDRGVDHVLIDEAQDTSPRQWEIIARIVSDFTAGEGARDGVKRTIFAVGDEKQSIFSFQGAAPRQFEDRRNEFRRKFEAAGLKFDAVSFTYSFRSGGSVLQAVQSAFQDQTIYRSITSDTAGMPPHLALADAPPSLIDLWDLQKPDEKRDLEGWDAPFDTTSESSPEVKLAGRIARSINTMIASRDATGRAGGQRALHAGDILILVRRRGKLFDAVIQALKRANIPVAGADRLKLTEHIAIIDLMHLADAVLLPQDDLALAVALKSPLFSLTEAQLFTLAYQRRGPLRDALRDHAADDPQFRPAWERLQACERAATQTPFAFYAWLLGGDRGRTRILQRLSHEADDALDEFLQLALTYEQRGPASLQGFMAWLRAADIEIKRDMDAAHGQVRVMTVHGAKGLEAPVVFLMDTTSSPSDTRRMTLIHLPDGNAMPGAANAVVWGGSKDDDPPAVAAARARMVEETEDEYRRLLYVAMTRAAERLIVGGVMPGNRKDVRENSWYDLIRKGLDASGLTVEILGTDDEPVRRYRRAGDAALAPPPPAASPAGNAPPTLPDWLRRNVTRPEPDRIFRRPSDDTAEDTRGHGNRATDPVRQRALKRGVLVHRLLQSLPDIPGERRPEAARQYLARSLRDENLHRDGWSETECDAIAVQTLGLLEDARFAPVFASGSRAEVPVVGRLERPGRPAIHVSGQIDRLVIAHDRILIVDYKTNHAPPRTPAGIPQAYRDQLALYRAVLRKMFPGKPVRAALIWTETAEIMELPEEMLDAAMAGIMSS